MLFKDIPKHPEYRNRFAPSFFAGDGDDAEANTEYISASVDFFAPPIRVEDGVTISTETSIGANVAIERCADIGAFVRIGHKAVIGAHVQVAGEAYIGSNVVLTAPPVSHMGEKREVAYKGIMARAIIGQNITIPSGVSIADGIVIPHSDSIVAVGPLGDSDRIVGVYGSDYGPRYSVGCQKGIPLDYFRERVATSRETDTSSTNRYKPYVAEGGILEQAGELVQEAYNDHLDHVAALREAQQDFVTDRRKNLQERRKS